MIDLWTKHNPTFNPFEPIDHKYTLFSDPVFNHAYKWIFEQIKNEQVIWTYANPEYLLLSHGYESKIWHLRVPEKEIIAVVNDGNWNDVLMGYPSYTNEEYNEWEKEVSADDNSWLENFDSFIDGIIKKHNGIKNNWKKFVFDIDDKKNHQILIPSPIKPEWVISCMHSSDYDNNKIEDEIVRSFFSSKEERNNHVEAMRSLLKGAKVEHIEEIIDNDYDGTFHCYFEWKSPNSED